MLLSILTLVALGSASFIKPPPQIVPHHAPAYPLAVNSPYLSAWLPSESLEDDNSTFPGKWPTFWNGKPLGLTGILRIDHKPCVFMGNPSLPKGAVLAQQLQIKFNNTNTTFWMNCDNKYLLEVNFFSPIHAIDPHPVRKYWRSSVPHSHLRIKPLNIDDEDHNLELYVDMTSEWVSGDPAAEITWDVGVADLASKIYPVPPSGGRWPGDAAIIQRRNIMAELQIKPEVIGYHKIERKQQLPFVEYNDQAEWGSWYFSTGGDRNYTWQSGSADELRQGFASTGLLKDISDKNFRATNDRLPTFAFARDLGFIKARHWHWSTVETFHYMISHHQDDVVQYLGSHENAVVVPSLATNIFPTHGDAISWCFNDRHRAELLADLHDSLVRKDTEPIGPKYTGMIALALRQIFGAMQWAGSPDRPLLFMKEMSSNGSVNTVDAIFAWHVMALYYDTDMLKAAMLPILIQAQHNWPHDFAIHDIGSQYPNATGHPDGNTVHMPVEETANMLVMMLAYVKRSDDKKFAIDHWPILRKWADYLVKHALYPEEQLWSDNLVEPLANSTHLALKGIYGIKAFLELSTMIEHADAMQEYGPYPTEFTNKWKELAITNDSSRHVMLTYGQEDSYILLYSMFIEKLLGWDIVGPQLMASQNEFYKSKLHNYGLQLDSRRTWTRVGWQMWIAGIADHELRGHIIDKVYEYLTTSMSRLPFPDLYDALTGRMPLEITFMNRPFVAGLFAPLALLEGADKYFH